MDISDLASPLNRLIHRFQSWDAALGGELDDAGEGLSRLERTALLDELLGLVADRSIGRESDTWRAVMGFFSARAATSMGERGRLEHSLLRAYEQLCELDLPFGVSSILLRHYSAIRRATHVADGRLNLPSPPRGSAVLTSAPTPAPQEGAGAVER